MDLLLTGGLVHDGTGAPGRVGDVGVRDGRIVLDRVVVGPSTRHLDVSGSVVCPGFVDVHTHSDLTLLSAPAGRSKVHQGVTTEVVGNCGLGVAPVAAPHEAVADQASIRSAVGYLDLDPAVGAHWPDVAGYLGAVAAARPTPNVATFVPHLPVHASVVGLDDRAPSPRQLARMLELVDQGCRDGAVGVSTGLVYAPLCYVGDGELTALGELVAGHGLLFAWHVRDYGDALLASVRQALRVARATGCRTQVSHLTAVGRRNWGSVRQALAEVDAANADGCDVGVDIYPYLAGNAPLSQLLPDHAQRGGEEAWAPRLRSPAVRREVAATWADAPFDWADIFVNAVAGWAAGEEPAGLLGRSVADLAEADGRAPDDVALDLLSTYGASVLMVAHGRSETDLRAVLGHPAAVVASDGQALDPDGPTGAGRPHPRSYGCFPRYLRRYAADLADGIRRCTSAPADRVGLTDRGRLADGLPADLLVLDPGRLADTATFEDPHRLAAGVDLVVVDGQVVLDHGVETGARPGAVLRPGGAAQPPPRTRSAPADLTAQEHR